MLRMPKEELKIELIKECKAEIKFIQSHGNVNASSQPIYKPSSIATQFLAMNDIKPLKKVGLFIYLNHGLLYIWTELLSIYFSWSAHMRRKFGTKTIHQDVSNQGSNFILSLLLKFVIGLLKHRYFLQITWILKFWLLRIG